MFTGLGLLLPIKMLMENGFQSVCVYMTDTTVLYLVISPEAEGGQIHLNIVSLMVFKKTN